MACDSALRLRPKPRYTSQKVEYIVDFPSPMWRLVDEPDEMHQHAEFVYNDRNDGYMRIRKEKLDEGLTVREFARRDQEQKVRFLPGYVDGKEDSFTGRMTGVTVSYEFTQAGKPMAGRTYTFKPMTAQFTRLGLPACAISSRGSAIRTTKSRVRSS